MILPSAIVGRILAIWLLGGQHFMNGAGAAKATEAKYCMPSDSCWPHADVWAAMNQSIGGSLFQKGTKEYVTATEMQAPNWGKVEGHGTKYVLPEYAVVILKREDVATAVAFASKYRIRISVKSTGHDFNGRSTADGALLIYLHKWKEVVWHDSFDDGCGNTAPAVTTHGGVQWRDIYPLLPAKGYLTTGGNSLTVGSSGGYLLGGGHGAMGPTTGLAVDNFMGGELVDANGQFHTDISVCKEPELFRTLRGGGAGYGVLVSATLRLHPAPKVVVGLDAFYPLASPNLQAFIATVIRLAPSMGSNYGGYFLGLPGQGLLLHVVYTGDSKEQATTLAAPLNTWMQAHPATGMYFSPVDHTSFWDWHGNTTDPTGTPVWAIGRLLPKDNFVGDGIDLTAKFLFDSIHQGIGFQGDSTVGGAVHTYDPTGNETSVSPWLRNSTWQLMMYTGWGAAATPAAQQKVVDKMSAKQQELYQLAPKSGAFWNEADYYEKNWKTSFWGSEKKYNRLLNVKKQVDPQGLFNCHHCVGEDEI